jgi:hypothetical protein
MCCLCAQVLIKHFVDMCQVVYTPTGGPKTHNHTHARWLLVQLDTPFKYSDRTTHTQPQSCRPSPRHCKCSMHFHSTSPVSPTNCVAHCRSHRRATGACCWVPGTHPVDVANFAVPRMYIQRLRHVADNDHYCDIPCDIPCACIAVGWACSNYHKLYRRPRGMFFSAQDKGEMVRGQPSGPSSTSLRCQHQYACLIACSCKTCASIGIWGLLHVRGCRQGKA